MAAVAAGDPARASLAVLASLGCLVLERREDGLFRAASDPPAWCAILREPAAHLLREGAPVDAAEVFPFLESFLPEAEDAWRGYGRSRADSDFWTEVDVGGHDIHLEAAAVCAAGAQLIVIMRNERLFLKEQSLLQRARELRQTHDSLTYEVEQKDILVHAIVHDLAAPLHSIMGVLSLLGEMSLPPRAEEWIKLGLEAAKRQRALIAEILDVFVASESQLSVGRATLGVELSDVLRRALAEREPVAKVKGLRLEGIGANLRARVIGDEARLFRVLTNLLDNAIRYSPPGGAVRVVVQGEDRAVVVQVDDEGRGVAPEHVPRLFEKFGRGDDRAAGTGLGLFYCRITLENWGGGIGYERSPHGGARFWVRLLRVRDPREAR